VGTQGGESLSRRKKSLLLGRTGPRDATVRGETGKKCRSIYDLLLNKRRKENSDRSRGEQKVKGKGARVRLGGERKSFERVAAKEKPQGQTLQRQARHAHRGEGNRVGNKLSVGEVKNNN